MKMDYIPVGDYCIPNLELPRESRPIGKWGRMHRRYLETYHPIRFNQLILSGTLWTSIDYNGLSCDRCCCFSPKSTGLFQAPYRESSIDEAILQFVPFRDTMLEKQG